jgi:hypothetical protein
MKTITKTIILMISLLWLMTIACPAQNKPRISSLQAKIFYNDSGTFSEDAIEGNVDLWNSLMINANKRFLRYSLMKPFDLYFIKNFTLPILSFAALG